MGATGANDLNGLSHPSRVRGLKRTSEEFYDSRELSHPSRVRGLKLTLTERERRVSAGSHPSRVRGLKLLERMLMVSISDVAPFTGAWIETRDNLFQAQIQIVAPFTGAWIETAVGTRLSNSTNSRTLHGCVD